LHAYAVPTAGSSVTSRAKTAPATRSIESNDFQTAHLRLLQPCVRRVSVSPCPSHGTCSLLLFTLSQSCCTVHRRAWRLVIPVQQSPPPPPHSTVQNMLLVTLHRLLPRIPLKNVQTAAIISFSHPCLLARTPLQRRELFSLPFVSLPTRRPLWKLRHSLIVVRSRGTLYPAHAISPFLFFDFNLPTTVAQGLA
jgi:hypothetical protein